MFGFIGFTASDAHSVINFTTYLGNDINGNHGIHMNPSIAAGFHSFLLFLRTFNEFFI
jgi:hypothetical protein